MTASATLACMGWRTEPKLENESIATRGSMPRCSTKFGGGDGDLGQPRRIGIDVDGAVGEEVRVGLHDHHVDAGTAASVRGRPDHLEGGPDGARVVLGFPDHHARRHRLRPPSARRNIPAAESAGSASAWVTPRALAARPRTLRRSGRARDRRRGPRCGDRRSATSAAAAAALMADGSPTRMGTAMSSSATMRAARSTRGSSASVNTRRWGRAAARLLSPRITPRPRPSRDSSRRGSRRCR